MDRAGIGNGQLDEALRLVRRRLTLSPTFDPNYEVGRELFEMSDITDVLTVLRIIFQTGLESIKSGYPEKVHFGIWRFPNGV